MAINKKLISFATEAQFNAYLANNNIDTRSIVFIEDTKSVLPIKDIFINDAEDKLKMLFGNKVKIKTGKKAGKIEIEFLTESDLDRIVEILLQQKKSKINDNDNTQFFV